MGRRWRCGGQCPRRRRGKALPCPFPVREKDHRERQVARIGPQGLGSAFGGFRDRAGFTGSGGELAQQQRLTFADDAWRVVCVGAENAGRGAVITRHRAVAEGVVGFLLVAVALHDQQQRLVIGAFVPAKGLLGAGADLVPDLPPHDRGGLTEGCRVLAAEYGAVGVVVEVDEMRPPPEEHGLAGGENDPDEGFQAVRPLRWRTKWGPRPVGTTHHRTKFASSGQEIGGSHSDELSRGGTRW